MSVINNSNSQLTVFVSKNITEIFFKYKQTKNQKEACGILIGTHSIDDSKIKILCATEPDCNDERSRFFFKIKSSKHNEVLQRRFKISANQEVYLGTWHTHAEDHPTPSKCDVNDWLKQYSINKHLFENMLFVVVGRKTSKWFIVNKGSLRALNRTNIQYDEGLV